MNKIVNSPFLEPNPNQCRTCIFRSPQDGGLVLGNDRMAEITEYLCKGKQHICHTNSYKACRGGRNIQLQVFTTLGFINEPTDEALQATNQKFLQSKNS